MSNTRTAKPKASPEPTSTEGDNVLDLDAARARRLEASGDAPSFKYNDKTFVLPHPAELPFDLAEQLASGDTFGALKTALGDSYEEFVGEKPAMGDVMQLVRWIGTLTAGSLGN